MNDFLDIHSASDAECRQAFRNVFDTWKMADDPEEHVARRLASPSHARAEWFVGTRGERVVTALGCHTLAFHLHGATIPGIAICSVHTVPEERGRGIAARLIRRVEEIRTARGALLALLYSDIAPAYYERMGYRLCPANAGWAEVPSPAAIPATARLVPFDPVLHCDELARRYEAFHASLPLWIARDADYWSHLLDRGPDDVFAWVDAEGQGRRGYVRMSRFEDRLMLRDFALDDSTDSAFEAMSSAAFRYAHDVGAKRIGGWLPDRPAVRACFRIEPRTMEITMLKSLDAAIELSDETCAAADAFCEVDHV